MLISAVVVWSMHLNRITGDPVPFALPDADQVKLAGYKKREQTALCKTVD